MTSFHFPPWLPVVIIIGVVGSILLVVILVREAGAVSPRIGQYWRAPYEIYVCGTRQPSLPFWSGGVNTYGDGIIHIRPQYSSEEGTGARLVKWFEYGGYALGTGGELSKNALHIPGQDKEYHNGDLCADGRPGVVQVFVNRQRLADFDRYIPHDGDQIQIVFGPEGELPPSIVASPTPTMASPTPTVGPAP